MLNQKRMIDAVAALAAIALLLCTLPGPEATWQLGSLTRASDPIVNIKD